MQAYPLTRPNRLRVARAFAPIPRVDVSIDCVIEDQMGKVFVDSVDNPQLWMIELDRFFCYYAGDLTTSAGRDFLSKTPHGRMLMAGPQGWHDVMPIAFDDSLVPIKRYTYASESLSPDHLKQLAANNPQTPNIQRMDATLARKETSFFEIGGYESPEDFVERAIGFCMVKDGAVIGVAYGSLVCSNAIEVSIFVESEYRRQGIATALAAQLLLWCLEHHLAPHWDAANEESCHLAEKLGYTKVGEYRAYYLK